jgi:hypothetical protein
MRKLLKLTAAGAAVAAGLLLGAGVALATVFIVPQGGTGQSTFTAHGILLGEGTSAIGATAAGASGQVLTSNGASSDPTFQTISPATSSLDYWLTTKSSSDLAEGSKLFFTNARAIASTLTGYSSGAGTVSSSDSILSAIQKLNGNIAALTTGVSSVFGRTGAVTAQSGDYTTDTVTEGTNKYYTDARVATYISSSTTVPHIGGSAYGDTLLWNGSGWTRTATSSLFNTAAAGITGLLSGTDWSTFNAKQSALSFVYPLVNTAGSVSSSLATTSANTWSGLQTFTNTGTTTFSGGLDFTRFNTSATSTGSNGIDISAGCFAQSGTCLQTFIQNATAYKQAVNYATAAALPANTYSNGVSGVGATLTEVGTGALTVDGQSASVGQRILVKNESTQANNGIYTVTAAGSGIAAYVLTRATDYNISNDIYAGTTVPVLAGGTANADTQWTETTTGTIVVGTTAIAFQESSLGTNVPTSVSNSDSSLTISPTTGAVVASLNLGNSNTWTALQKLYGAASSTLFSAHQAYFGATATSTFGTNGALTLATPLTSGNGGTGTTTWLTNSIPYFDGTRFTEKNSLLSFDGNKLNLTNASSTNLTNSGYAVLSGMTGIAASCLYVDTNGKITGTGAACGSAVGGTVTSVTAATPNSTLTLGGTNPVTTSGTINFDLNLANSNIWTALQRFSNASSTLFSNFGTAYFGGTATSSFSSTGALTLATPLTTGNGGTGTTTWQTNSIPYFDGTRLTESNAGFNWNGLKLTATNASTTNFSASTAFYSPVTSALLLGDANKLVGAASTQTCTNQFLRAMSAAYSGTCATVGAADVSLANLSATDSTLTFSGTYTGSTARTIGLNLAQANTWTGLQQFQSAASTTMLSVYNTLYVGTTATTTISGTATSTFGAGISGTYLNLTGSSATSTFSNGISLSGGCILVGGACLGGSSSAFDYQVFTGSGTWTKPSGLGGTELVIVEIWGAGGGGGGSGGGNDAGGGGGGGGGFYYFRASDLDATDAVTIGASGAGGTGSGVGTAGGRSCLSSTSSCGGTIYASEYGGGGGASLGGGGGGGSAFSVGGQASGSTDGSAGSPAGGAGGGANATYGGGGGGHNGQGGSTVWGGGGGGSYNNSSSQAGGSSMNGGAGATQSGNGVGNNGTAPGGGGSGGAGGSNNAGGAGARGEVRIWVQK